jgi:hypothetical protein
MDILFAFPIKCLQPGQCSTNIYFALPYIIRMTPRDNTRGSRIYAKGLYVHLYKHYMH